LGSRSDVDYEKEDWSKRNDQYDYIFDSVGITTFNKCKHLLTKKGRFLSAGGSISNVFTVLAAPLKRGKKGVFWASMNVKTV
jgi:NADPH:quinone reductase-like Zn-dependent oxidoreductase